MLSRTCRSRSWPATAARLVSKAVTPIWQRVYTPFLLSRQRCGIREKTSFQHLGQFSRELLQAQSGGQQSTHLLHEGAGEDSVELQRDAPLSRGAGLVNDLVGGPDSQNALQANRGQKQLWTKPSLQLCSQQSSLGMLCFPTCSCPGALLLKPFQYPWTRHHFIQELTRQKPVERVSTEW